MHPLLSMVKPKMVKMRKRKQRMQVIRKFTHRHRANIRPKYKIMVAVVTIIASVHAIVAAVVVVSTEIVGTLIKNIKTAAKKEIIRPQMIFSINGVL